jgi:PIN domain nuclease of toxin-antitoxin system
MKVLLDTHILLWALVRERPYDVEVLSMKTYLVTVP